MHEANFFISQKPFNKQNVSKKASFNKTERYNDLLSKANNTKTNQTNLLLEPPTDALPAELVFATARTGKTKKKINNATTAQLLYFI